VIAAPVRAQSDSARSLLEIFDVTLARHATRVALDAEDGALTYAELSAAADRLASSLREHGVGPGERVGIHLESGSWKLYAGIIGVLRAGAAYVPIDADDPPARAAAIWEQADVCCVLEEDLRLRVLREPHAPERTLHVDHDAWIIFTSGSTGRPKGVAVSHRSAAAFVEAEQRLWTVSPEDRVLAGLSVSFDASCEEMWLAWASGATLVPAPRAVVRSGADLAPWLMRHRITVISTVPTLAAMWDEHTLAEVRLLILGGEACPEELGWRLARGREVWNTYGPTEATVVSTAAPVRAGAPLMIGWPLAGWSVAVVDVSGAPVPVGEPGELVIGGVGLGRYLDPDLDAERYAALPALGWVRAYRSGDVVRETIDGFQFLGRRDGQVKLAGRRLELGDVECKLSAVAGVRAAAAAVQSTAAGNKVLVGYVVGDVDAADVRAAVAEHLPDGVAPVVVILDALPVAGSGKLDRKALPWPPPEIEGPTDPHLSGTAAWLAERFSDQLGPVAISAETDFFACGGSSLAAAKLVSALRARFPAVAVSDVYEYRQLGRLAARLDELGERRGESRFELASASWQWGAVQLLGMLALLVIHASEWVIGAFAYADVLAALHVASGLPQVPWPWLLGAWLVLATPMGRTGIVLAAKRALLPGLEPGCYPRHSWLASRIWFLERLTDVCRLGRLAGTPWANRYARLLGADVAEGARLSSVPQPGALVHIGAGATLEADVDMHGWWMDGQQLVVDEVRIGAGARVGTRSMLMPGALVGEGAEVEPGSVVSGTVPSGERWAGAPARYDGRAGGRGWLEHAPANDPWPRSSLLLYGTSLTIASLLPVLAFVPGILVLRLLGAPTPTLYSSPGAIALEAFVLTSTFLLSYALLVAGVARLMWRLLRPGWHVERGPVGCAHWFSENVLSSARTILFPLYCSLYTRPWLRLMGLAIGRRCELSTAVGLNNLASFEELSFAADDVALASARARHGWLHLGPIAVGKRTFIGNSSVLRHGTEVGANSIIGVLTVAPPRSTDGTCWLGSPALELPRIPDSPDPARTTDPPLRLIIGRGAMDLVRILLPWTTTVVLGWVAFMALSAIGLRLGILVEVASAPLVLLATGVVAAALTILLKWLVIGRYRSGQHPFWSFFVWRDELINSAQELLAGQWLIAFAMGTPLMSLYLRAMGARVGRAVWCETMAITEFDLVDIEDGAVINRHACIQTHLFHDRLLRMGPSTLGAGSTLGPSSAVLPDTKLGAGTCVGARSVVMRGEELPDGTRWHGAPVVAIPSGAGEPGARSDGDGASAGARGAGAQQEAVRHGLRAPERGRLAGPVGMSGSLAR
jgi:non-ribosomal peptide synthetase-like protein